MAVLKQKLFTPGNNVKELWVAATEQELEEEFRKVEAAYPVTGYGTMIHSIVRRADGAVEAIFYRFNSCD